MNVPQWNVTVSADGQDRRSVLGVGQSSDVSVTFYNTPGTMDCTDGENRLPIFYASVWDLGRRRSLETQNRFVTIWPLWADWVGAAVFMKFGSDGENEDARDKFNH